MRSQNWSRARPIVEISFDPQSQANFPDLSDKSQAKNSRSSKKTKAKDSNLPLPPLPTVTRSSVLLQEPNSKH